MRNLDEFVSDVNLKKEILETMPKNNVRDLKAYISKLQENLSIAQEEQAALEDEIKKRYKKIRGPKISDELKNMMQRLENSEGVLYLLNEMDTSYEKMNLDKALFNLNHYYSKNLEMVNDTILYCIKKFEEVGVKLELKDFNYSEYVKEYLKVFFAEMEKGTINSNKTKNKFDEIYWKCPNLIIHIVLNIKYLYLRKEKEIDKYFKNQKTNLIKNFTAKDIIERTFELSRQVDEYISNSKEIITNKLLDGELNIKDYSETNITDCYLKFIDEDDLNLNNEEKINETDKGLDKLLNSLCEYKMYLESKFIVDDIVKIYNEKEKYKNAYANTLKEINKKEKKRISLNSKLEKNGLFNKSKDKIRNERDLIIDELTKLHKELEQNKVYNTILEKLDDNSNIKEALMLANSFYRYTFLCICEKFKGIEENDIEEKIQNLEAFINYPYCTIINNIKMTENKEIWMIIKDRYKLLNINIEKEDLELDNIDPLINTIKVIMQAHNIRKNKIDLNKIECGIEFKKILNI